MSPSVVKVLLLRDLIVFVKQPSRIVGTLAQPLLFWVVLGTGLAPSFAAPGGGPGYQTYFFPGIVVMLVLFTSISATMSVIEDRHQGFLQGVLAAPGGRGALAVGKTLGGAAVGWIQAALLLLLLPVAGYSFGGVGWPVALLSLALATVALTAVGFVLAWRIDSTAGYHVVMSLILLPLWVLSGALFPLEPTHTVMAWIGKLNPMTYAVSTFRAGLEGASLGQALPGLGLLAALALATLALAVWSTRSR